MRKTLATLGVGALAASLAQAAPGKPEDNGLTPVTPTTYVNTVDTINNNSTESIGIAIAKNGNVIVGWEDDGDALADNEAVWTLFDRDGKLLSQDAEITTIDPAFAGQTLTSHFFSYFRKDGSPISGRTAWGPKIKANLFGDGIGMGAIAFDLGIEVPEFAPFQFDGAGNNVGDVPAVQLLGNDGSPKGIVSGMSATYVQRDGDIRIGDWDYLSNGNLVLVGESRQKQDLVDVYGGESAQTHVVFRITTPAGAEVKPERLVSATPTVAQMWHGVGVTKNGFAVRFQGDDGRGKLRFYDNLGTATTTTNVDLGKLVGNELAAAGGRGDGVGFHGNGIDAYALMTLGNDADGRPQAFVTVLNANGSVRWSKVVSDDITLLGGGRGDVGIDALGRVVVVYEDKAGTDGNQPLVLGRLFDATGKALGGTFYVSENELPSPDTLKAATPRVSFRNDTVAVAWISNNSGAPDNKVLALRQFVIPVRPGSVESVGLTRIVPDVPVVNPGLDALGNWEPYTSVLGTSTFLVEANTFAAGTTDKQRFVVALQPATGGVAKLVEGFYGDDGKPYNGEINGSRQNGNPGRVAGDTHPGARNYVVAGEASPHNYAPFQSGGRWNTGYDRTLNGSTISRYGTVQPFSLDTATLTPTPLAKAFDVANGRITSGGVASDQNSRFGGDVVVLSNGNFVGAVEDRSKLRNPDGNCAVATVFKADGTIVKETFKVANGDLWANLAAFKGGFAVRVVDTIYLYDNDGNPTGTINQASSGDSTFSTGRGDGTRIAGHINSPYVYLAGRASSGTQIRVAVWNAVTREFVAISDVSEGGFRATADRATVTVDALNRLVVAWVTLPDGYEQNQVAARVLALDEATKTVKPLTPSFFPFINTHPVGIKTFQMSVAMTTKQVLVAAKGSINLANRPADGVTSPNEINFYTVFSHPNPQDDPTAPLGGAPLVLGKPVGNGNNLVLSWTGGTGPFTVQSRPSATSGNWTTVTTTGGNSATVPISGDAAFIRVVGQ